MTRTQTHDTISIPAYSPTDDAMNSWLWAIAAERERISGEPSLKNFRKWQGNDKMTKIILTPTQIKCAEALVGNPNISIKELADACGVREYSVKRMVSAVARNLGARRGDEIPERYLSCHFDIKVRGRPPETTPIDDGMKWPDYGPHNLKFPVGVPCCAR